ncbi:MAG: N-acetyltransferase [Oscillospiraceae bacterium]|jgi:predicted GNAT family acetyltransferase|nr:N-acetyltransferase [Oscillospiraceae bacterium]
MDFTIETNRIYHIDKSGKLLAEVLFPQESEHTVAITRTFVDESLRGQGVADKLLMALTEALKADGRKAKPNCAYALKWFEKHPEMGELLAD